MIPPAEALLDTDLLHQGTNPLPPEIDPLHQGTDPLRPEIDLLLPEVIPQEERGLTALPALEVALKLTAINNCFSHIGHGENFLASRIMGVAKRKNAREKKRAGVCNTI